LAYLLWDSPPDATLLAAADAHALVTPEGRRTQAERMLEDPRSQDAVVEFFREWTHSGQRDLTGRVPDAVAAGFQEEIRRFAIESSFQGGPMSVQALMSSDSTFVNRSLAMHYGLDTVPADDATWMRVTLPTNMQAGLLTRGAVAAGTSSNDDTSIVQRGHFVREDLLCEELGTPPNGARALDPMLPATATVRQKIAARASVTGCAYCHDRMDLIGIGMEDLDNVGQIRTMYRNGNPLDLAGEIRVVGSPDSIEFQGAHELGQTLAGDDRFTRCAVRQWFRYSMGRDDETTCNVGRIHAAVAAGGYDMRELIISVIESESFISRTDSAN
jgi:hypothetical protein